MEIKRFFQFEIIIALSALFEFSVMGLGPVSFFQLFQCGDRLHTSESEFFVLFLLLYTHYWARVKTKNSYGPIYLLDLRSDVLPYEIITLSRNVIYYRNISF